MTKQTGLSMTEVLTALVLVGLIAALTVPSFMTNAGTKQNITKTKNVISELHHARSLYRDGVPNPDDPPDSTTIGALTKYAGVDLACNAKALATGPPTAPSTFNFADSTDGTTDCYRYPDGSVLEAEIGAGPDTNILRVNFYPDGPDGKVDPVSLRMDWDNDRITSWHSYDTVGGTDPDWAKDWTKF